MAVVTMRDSLWEDITVLQEQHDLTMTCKGAAAFPEKCSVWSSGLAPRDPTQDLPVWLGCVGCGESKTETEQVMGTQPCTEKEQVWQMKPQNTARMGRQPG